MQILGISGSPRRGGNTEIIINEALRAAAAEGAEVTFLCLSDYQLTPCTACRTCFDTNQCTIQDDVEISDALRRLRLVPLSLADIKQMAAMDYPVPVAANLIVVSPLSFSIRSEAQFAALQREGLPDLILKAIMKALSAGRGAVVPPVGRVPPVHPGPDIEGMWEAQGRTARGVEYRYNIIFGRLGLYSYQAWFGMRFTGVVHGRYRSDGRSVTVQLDTGPSFTTSYRVRGDVLTLDIPELGRGITFRKIRDLRGDGG